MKKWLYVFTTLLLLTGCSDDKKEQRQQTPVPTARTASYENKTFAFTASRLETGCQDASKMVCAVNLAVKCTLDPGFSECDKSKMPRFIFMQDDSLDRPSELSYKIKKIRPLQDGTVEIITDSSCNGNWFGLCNGTVIYVMKLQNEDWIVQDIYALQEL